MKFNSKLIFPFENHCFIFKFLLLICIVVNLILSFFDCYFHLMNAIIELIFFIFFYGGFDKKYEGVIFHEYR